MENFRNVDNMKLCIVIFEKYMNDKYNVDIKTFKDSNVKIELYNIMNELSDDPSFINNDLKNQNNIVINELKNLYIEKYKIIENKKTHINNLDRENTIYGNRRNIPNNFQPMITNVKDEILTISSNFENMQKERGFDVKKEEFKPKSEPLKINPMSEEDFTKQLKDRETLRNDIFNTIIPEDQTLLFKQSLNPLEDNKTQSLKKYVNYSEEKIIDKPNSKSISQYVLINGYDRNLKEYPNRFKFTIDFSKLSKTYKNISKLSFTNLIIPSNVNETNTKITGMSSPFIMLNIDELSGVYDGFSDSSRKCFTQFMYDNSYTTANGRGYIILKPCQHEHEREHANFNIVYPSFQRLSMSLCKPNGSLINDSKDSNSILKIEYELFNPMYLKIHTNTFFEKNEFYKEDIILFNDVSYPVNKNDPTSDDFNLYNQDRVLFDKISEFISRPEGHEIIDIGTANENGFYRSFYINAMTVFDENCGKMVVNKDMVTLIQSYNERLNPSYTPFGRIVNSSLQISLSCRVDYSQSDSSVLILQDR